MQKPSRGGHEVMQGEKHERIQAMLIRYRDCLYETKAGEAGADRHDSRELRYPRAFNHAMQELDRCLTKMRSLGNQQALQGIPLKTVHWHLVAYYIDVHYRTVPVVRYVTGKDHKRHSIQTGKLTLEPQRHRDVRPDKAALGIPWLAAEYQWDKVHMKAIAEACGEHEHEPQKVAA
jgi:hypothetical protein